MCKWLFGISEQPHYHQISRKFGISEFSQEDVYEVVGFFRQEKSDHFTVLDVVKAFEKVNNVKVPYSIKPRRAGDIATCYCNPEKAFKELGWKAQYGIEEMCRDAWNWQKQNPNGYKG